MFFSNYEQALKNYNENKNSVPPPPGEYVAVISGVKNNPDSNGKSFLLVSFKVDEGEHENARLSTRFYYENEVGASRLIALSNDAKVPTAAKFDENALVGKKVIIKVKSYTNSKTGDTGVEFHYSKPFDPNAVAPNQEVAGVPFA